MHSSFYVDKGGFIGIMGASGSGKTTILNILSTIDSMNNGQVFYDAVDISKMNEDELSDFRQKNLGFVFQDYNLLDTLNVEENIMLPMVLIGKKKEEMHIDYGKSGEISTAGIILITFMTVSAIIILIIVGWLINFI